MSHFNALILMGFLDYFTGQTNEEEVVVEKEVNSKTKKNKNLRNREKKD